MRTGVQHGTPNDDWDYGLFILCVASSRIQFGSRQVALESKATPAADHVGGRQTIVKYCKRLLKAGRHPYPFRVVDVLTLRPLEDNPWASFRVIFILPDDRS